MIPRIYLPLCLIFIVLAACAKGGTGPGNNNQNNINNQNNTNNTNNCAGTCTPGHARCVNHVLETCGETATCPQWQLSRNCWEHDEICVFDAELSTARCEEGCRDLCEADQRICISNQVFACEITDGCLDFVLADDCIAQSRICQQDELGSNAQCQDVCTSNCDQVGQQTCSGTTIQTCSSVDGCLVWVSGTNCAATDRICHVAQQVASCQTDLPMNLYFSEYLEGSSNNKALEIYARKVPGSFNISSCVVHIYYNGASTASTNINMGSRQMSAGSTYVVCHSSIDESIAASCDLLVGNLSFNGDDAVVLSCSGIVLDIFGEIGVDPGDAWVSGDVSTMDMTLRRKCGIFSGRTTEGPFDPALEWNAFPVNTFSDLGTYTPCN